MKKLKLIALDYSSYCHERLRKNIDDDGTKTTKETYTVVNDSAK
jgi:hypothetical protein